MNYTVDQVRSLLVEGNFRFNDALKAVYEFIWNDFCDWYIEMSKSVLFGSDAERKATVQQVLLTCLDNALRVLHPFMPFVTEEIWQKLPGSEGFLMESSFPEADKSQIDTALEAEMNELMEAVRVVRNMRASANISPAKKLTVRVVNNGNLSNVYHNQVAMICALAGIEKFEIVDKKPVGHLVGLAGAVEICIDLAGVIDIAVELARVTKEIENTEKNMAKIAPKLENQNFVSKAPAEVVDRIRNDVEGYKKQLAKLKEYQNELKSI